MVDKNSTLIIRNVSEEAHRNLRILAASSGKQQGELLAELLEAAIERYKQAL